MRPARNRYTLVDDGLPQPRTIQREDHRRGTIVSIPYITIFPMDCAEAMRGYLALPATVFGCTVAILVLIVVGGSLPPGFVDPATHRIRFVSDGFKDYRFLPFACLGLLAAMVVCFSLFAWRAYRSTRVEDRRTAHGGVIVASAGLVSLAGFALVAFFTEGWVHITGAGVFIFSYVLMQFFMDMVLWGVHKGTWLERTMEYGILSITLFAALLFVLLLAVGSLLGGDPALHSGSAISEYVVFVAFISLNAYGISLMTYILAWYMPSKGSGVWEPTPQAGQGP